MSEAESQAAALDAFLTREPAVACRRGESVAVFRAVPGNYLSLLKGNNSLTCLQSYKPLADELIRSGNPVSGEIKGACQMAIVFATKHKEEVLYHIALAIETLTEGGTLIVTAANTLGASSLEDRVSAVLGGIVSYSKHKCRVFTAIKRKDQINNQLLREWTRAGELRKVAATGLQGCPGLFSWKAIDVGSQLLARHLPSDLSGRGADLGAGYGYLSISALQRNPGIRELHLVEAESKGIQAARHNLCGHADEVNLHFHWLDVSAGTGLDGLNFVIMNPPFHTGRSTTPALGRTFISEAFKIMRPGGRLFMVANRHLRYETEFQKMPGVVESVTQEHGFKVIAARKTG